MAIIFVGLWGVITIPIALSVVFSIIKPVVMADNTGISAIIIVVVVALLDGYIGIKIFEKKIEPWLLKRKKKRNFP
ncbi:hypothetical protein BKP45_10340 [Anaerobacillus alkalidiazotrophicus]|uniref:Uncharacterized protein n=1 Tax=Anaerobacillus alkalidiazotrophicus TaxID=472963 RepID=A0A1S2M6Q4_9BACI|nr:hypothetical protein [Anaerobacillus alkalidiazotrophicus]OIJ20170.1 hypothetical protein BKP45_10340 [Anaerobacillus alkalidiazotrophicus]